MPDAAARKSPPNPKAATACHPGSPRWNVFFHATGFGVPRWIDCHRGRAQQTNILYYFRAKKKFIRPFLSSLWKHMAGPSGRG